MSKCSNNTLSLIEIFFLPFFFYSQIFFFNKFVNQQKPDQFQTPLGISGKVKGEGFRQSSPDMTPDTMTLMPTNQ